MKSSLITDQYEEKIIGRLKNHPATKDIYDDIIKVSKLTPDQHIKMIRNDLIKKHNKGDSNYKIKRQPTKVKKSDPLQFFHLMSKSPLEQLTTKIFFNDLIENKDYMINIRKENEKMLKKVIKIEN